MDELLRQTALLHLSILICGFSIIETTLDLGLFIIQEFKFIINTSQLLQDFDDEQSRLPRGQVVLW